MSPETYSEGISSNVALFAGAFSIIIILLIVWSFIWKGIALWKCGRNNQLGWYIVLLIINTAGILEILYILFFQKNKNQPVNQS